jgi:hypothetical protein
LFELCACRVETWPGTLAKGLNLGDLTKQDARKVKLQEIYQQEVLNGMGSLVRLAQQSQQPIRGIPWKNIAAQK